MGSKKHDDAMDYIYDRCASRMLTEEELNKICEISPMCCVHPPSDGSLCAGGTCACTDDYECDKCRGVTPSWGEHYDGLA